MIEIDGLKGGGQMLRTALSLSVITGENFRMENIRGSREGPGLKKQHLEAVKAAKRLSDAEVEGCEEDSTRLEFKPGNYRSEDFTVNIGTAGSTTLILDTIVPIATQFDDDFRITVKGGTDVKWSPSSAYWKHVKLELLRNYGLNASTQIERTGFYPKGNGEIEFNYKPSSLGKLDLTNKGELREVEIYSKCSKDLAKDNVASRQADKAAKKIKKNFPSLKVDKNVSIVNSSSPGSSVCIKAIYQDSLAGFDNIGERGKRSETVAEEAVEEFLEFHRSESAVDKYMADQLMVFLALVGGKIAVKELNPHISTNLSVINKFGFDIEVEEKERTYLKG
ncbi:MAG: RNA 3'-terminal phosphate cyclase [Candidatus Nanohaloarchaea archaeon]